MSRISLQTMQFLKDLRENNHRDWFLDHKKEYDSAREEFVLFVAAIIREIANFDVSIAHQRAKDCVFRIYRDVRFSKDKSPYKTHLGAFVTSATKKSEIHTKAGYYIHLEPGASMLAGGAYLPEGPWLKAIRQEIAYNSDEFRTILNAPDFRKYFGEMEGEKLKKAPKDYEADHPDIELLKHKSYLAANYCKDHQVTAPDFFDFTVQVFSAMYPFNHFLNRAMD